MWHDALRIARRERLTDPKSWAGRVMVWVAAVAVGLTIVGFAELSTLSFSFFESLRRRWEWLPLLLTPAVGMASMWLTLRFFPGAEGGGIPQVIAAASMAVVNSGARRFVSARIALGKIALVVLALAGGFTAGREGPSVQVGSGLLLSIRPWLPRGFRIDGRSLLVAGGAAGMAAAFNTPLAGIVFGIEQLMRRFDERTNGVLIAAIVWAGLVPLALLGDYTFFGRIVVPEVGLSIGFAAVGIGILCGVAGGGFNRAVLAGVNRLPALSDLRDRRPVLFSGACGLAIAIIGVTCHGTTFGGGYEATRDILAGTFSAPWYYTLARFASTVLTAISAIPAGIFAPSLAIGAGIGYDLLPLAPYGVTAAAMVAMGMAAYLAAVTDAPLTSFIVVMEMVDSHAMLLPLIVATMVARLVSRLLSEPLYETLARRFENPHATIRR